MNKIDELFKIINSISDVNRDAINKATMYNSKLAKPIDSLGELEDIAIKVSGITNKVKNNIKKKRLLIFASDNGVASEHVSSSPVSVTKKQTINLTKGITGSSSLCKAYKTEIEVYDVGVISDIDCPDVINKKIRYGTGNFVNGPALSRKEVVEAVFVGMEAVRKAKVDKVDIIGVGEMGIANTTTSSAVLASITELDPKDVTGYGAGLTDSELVHKIDVIRRGIEVNKPNKDDIIDVLSKVGGLDICAMTGAFLGASLYKIPVVIDGLISSVAAMCSYKLCKYTVNYMFPSHISIEPGYMVAINELGLKPYLNLGMHLGEGSGCPIAFEIIKGACYVFSHMATFKKATINDDYLDYLRKGNSEK